VGWASAYEIFDPVCQKLQASFLWDSTRKDILITLIKVLQELDWDTEDESLELFSDDPVTIQAFAACGVHLTHDELEDFS
jgi:hypothetical protein